MRPGWKTRVSFSFFCDDWEEASLIVLGYNKENMVLDIKVSVFIASC